MISLLRSLQFLKRDSAPNWRAESFVTSTLVRAQQNCEELSAVSSGQQIDNATGNHNRDEGADLAITMVNTLYQERSISQRNATNILGIGMLQYSKTKNVNSLPGDRKGNKARKATRKELLLASATPLGFALHRWGPIA